MYHKLVSARMYEILSNNMHYDSSRRTASQADLRLQMAQVGLGVYVRVVWWGWGLHVWLRCG